MNDEIFEDMLAKVCFHPHEKQMYEILKDRIPHHEMQIIISICDDNNVGFCEYIYNAICKYANLV